VELIIPESTTNHKLTSQYLSIAHEVRAVAEAY